MSKRPSRELTTKTARIASRSLRWPRRPRRQEGRAAHGARLRKAAGFTDFFVIATGAHARQIRAIAEAVKSALVKLKAKPSHTEGYERTEWILLDYFDFVVHVFSGETRAFYGLERLWGSATAIDLTGV